jgi:hypothetical protein
MTSPQSTLNPIKTVNLCKIMLAAGLWIRIRIRIGSGLNNFVNPDGDSGARKRRKKVLFIYFYNGKLLK